MDSYMLTTSEILSCSTLPEQEAGCITSSSQFACISEDAYIQSLHDLHIHDQSSVHPLFMRVRKSHAKCLTWIWIQDQSVRVRNRSKYLQLASQWTLCDEYFK